MSELEKTRKKPINIGGEYSLGFIIPSKWCDHLGLDKEKEATLILEDTQIVIRA